MTGGSIPRRATGPIPGSRGRKTMQGQLVDRMRGRPLLLAEAFGIGPGEPANSYQNNLGCRPRLPFLQFLALDCVQFYPDRPSHRLNSRELADPGCRCRITKNRHSHDFGCKLFSNSSHFAPMLNSNKINPVALLLGRARLATKPAPTGSAACRSAQCAFRPAMPPRSGLPWQARHLVPARPTRLHISGY